jgi:predicted GNAT family N-acyltransferase
MEINGFRAVRDGRFGEAYAADHPKGGKVWLRPARADEMPFLHQLNVSEISPLVGPERAMRDVQARNPDALWVIEHRSEPGAGPRVIGCYGFLPLTDAGLDALRADTLVRRDPQLDLIAEAGTRPAGMYVWTVIGHGLARATQPLTARALAPYADVPFFTICMTEKGLQAARRRGFVPVDARIGDRGALVMLPMRSALGGADQDAVRDPRLDVIVASNAEHFHMEAYVRGAVFGAEQLSPYREEFDGNDYCALHLIGFVDSEPAAVMRVRFFASFAKLERLAVLERYRRTEIKRDIVNRAIDLCRRKGYRKLYGHAQTRLVPFYAKFGFRPMEREAKLVFADHAYVEIEADLAPHESPISIQSDPYVIIRPEGAWDRPGVLDLSAARPATNPI